MARSITITAILLGRKPGLCCSRCKKPFEVGDPAVVTSGYGNRYHRRCFIEY